MSKVACCSVKKYFFRYELAFISIVHRSVFDRTPFDARSYIDRCSLAHRSMYGHKKIVLILLQGSFSNSQTTSVPYQY